MVKYELAETENPAMRIHVVVDERNVVNLHCALETRPIDLFSSSVMGMTSLLLVIKNVLRIL